jgi:hypothetical protein
MKTEKKNQHFIPKFYLKYFSYEKNEKQIGVFNKNRNFFFQKATLKDQGSKNFFYGYDGIVEDNLSNVEGHLATSLRKIINENSTPKKYNFEHFQLLNFVALTHLRNPVSVQSVKDIKEIVKERLQELDSTIDIDKFIISTAHEEAIEMVISQLPDVVNYMVDLNYKLLINKTKTPFISSDFPIVKCNTFLELKNWKRGKTGFGNTGLQIFIPINPNLIIAFFDSKIYKIGNKKDNYLNILSEKDINQLNLLQFLNCYNTIYFNEKCTEKYIRELFEKSKKYENAHKPIIELSYSSKKKMELKEEKDIISVQRTDCEIKLNIQGIKTHSNAKKVGMQETIKTVRQNILKFVE